MMQLIEDVGFDTSFSFIFSPRPGTPGRRVAGRHAARGQLARLQQLQAAVDANVRRISASRQGTVQRVLVEGAARKNAAELFGAPECNRLVVFEGRRGWIGQMVEVCASPRRLQRGLRGEVVVREAA